MHRLLILTCILAMATQFALARKPRPNLGLLKDTIDVSRRVGSTATARPRGRERLGSIRPTINVGRRRISERVFEKTGSVLPKKVGRLLPSTSQLTSFVTAANKQLSLENTILRKTSSVTKNNDNVALGPHMITDNEAVELAQFADVMLDVATSTVKRLGSVSRQVKKQALAAVSKSSLNAARSRLPSRLGFCPFNKKPACASNYKYRTADGTCNNKKNPLWGKAFSAFERFIANFYDDQLRSPRSQSVNGGNLPNARTISNKVHTNLPHEDNKLSHFTMEFGQFVSHDIQRNALSKGYRGSNLDCCGVHRRSRNCLPIDITDPNDYFRTHGTSCINFVRALSAPSFDCKLGPRNQLNQVTHFLDGSAIYGSSQKTQNELRTKSSSKKGELKATTQSGSARDLPLQETRNVCRTSSKCFKTGDVRSNQQPLLMSLHTIWLREHNRIAKKLSSLNPDWNDEKVFQESRKIVIAELQHVTYTEFLPLIVGPDLMRDMDLKEKALNQYHTGYDDEIKPHIRNGFMSAAYRFGHSMIRNDMKKSTGTTSTRHTFKDVMLKSDLVYGRGVGDLTRGMYQDPNYKADRHMTHEVTRHLFQTANGNGIDLAAANIQRGRDHGIADYNIWREVCQLGAVDDFSELDLHDTDVWKLLKTVYKSVDDIDFFTGGISEKHISGGGIGPTFACIVALQFKILKKADRFFYESNTDVKFPISQLNEIKGTSMARIICDNTDLTRVPRNVFKKESNIDPSLACNTFASVNLDEWIECRDNGFSAWSQWKTSGSGHLKRNTRTRTCARPLDGCCGARKERKIVGNIFDLKSSVRRPQGLSALLRRG